MALMAVSPRLLMVAAAAFVMLSHLSQMLGQVGTLKPPLQGETPLILAIEPKAAVDETTAPPSVEPQPAAPSPPGLSLEEQRAQSPQRALMVTYVFGRPSADKRRLRMWAETTGRAGAAFDFAIVGDAVPPFPLPANIRHVMITWEELVDRIVDKVFHGGRDIDAKKVRKLRQSTNLYKVCDYKPLFAFLFPEQVAGYQWWGHLDNDAIFGNLTKLVPQEMLQQYDVIAGDTDKPKHLTWGPFMLYRNTPELNGLFLKNKNAKGQHDLSPVIDPTNYHFDEGGKPGTKGSKGHMTALVREHGEALGIRQTSTTAGMVWDIGDCGRSQRYKKQYTKISPTCGECIFEPNNKDGKLLRRSRDDEEVFICHYQWAKALGQIDVSLDNTEKFEGLLKAGEFRATFRYGFDFIGQTDPAMIEYENMAIARSKETGLK